MSTFIGTIEAFMPGGNFAQYRSRMDHLLNVNDVKEAKKTPLLCTLIGPVCYNKLESLVAPEKPAEKSYKELMDVLEAHFKPANNIIAERCRFFTRNRRDGESIEEYVVELKALAQECQFGDFLKEALRDRLVSGINDSEIKSKLLLVSDLTWESAIQICKAESLARKNVREMDSSTQRTNAVEASGKHKHQNHQAHHKKAPKKDGNPKETFKNPCQRCGQFHRRGECPAIGTKCRACGQMGHWAEMCRSAAKKTNQGKQNSLHLHQTASPSNFQFTNPMLLSLKVDNLNVNFEVDTGAVCTVMGADFFKENFPNKQLENTSIKLQQANGDPATVLGRFEVTVSTFHLPIFVIATSGYFTPLLGRDWLDVLFPGWRDRILIDGPIQKVTNDNLKIFEEIKRSFPNVCNTEDKSPIREFEAHIHMKDNVSPIFFKSRVVPFNTREKVERELIRLCEEDVIEPVQHSSWASPVVVVPKGDGIRLCVDYKVSINKHVLREHYPLPQIDDLLAKLSAGKVFCAIDLQGAYQQISVNESSREYLTMNTIKGLYRFKRMPFGVSSAPSVFQSIIDQILNGVQGVVCYLDDLLIYGESQEEVKKILWEVLNRLNNYNVKINVAKCRFFVDTIQFLGHVISQGGVKPNPEKLIALENAPQPENLKQLQAFIGLVNYYGKFIPNLAAILRPLYDLLKKENQVGNKLKWSKSHTECFDRCKTLLKSEDILCHFNPKWEIVVAADASPDGLGAVLSHICPDGVERPIYYASRTLSPAEKNYSQLDKEAAALIFAIKKFYKFLYGHKFTIYSDHQPLISIFDQKKNNSLILSPRMQRWQGIISTFDCELKYRPGKHQGNCDGLSRLPVECSDVMDDDVNLKTLHVSESPINYEIVKAASQSDLELTKLRELIVSGWPENPEKLPDNMRDYWKFRSSLSVEDDCIYYGFRIVIPRCLQKKILYIIHESHCGIVKMKMIARSLVWWKGIDKKIEEFVSQCEGCVSTSRSKPQDTFKWKETSHPFERVHIDFFHYCGKEVIVLIDSYSRWVEAKVMSNTSAGKVIEFLGEVFMRMGTPKELVSDNGPPFGSVEFKDYCEGKNIMVLKSPPYHPQSNGICERVVQTVKNALKREMISNHFAAHQLPEKLNDFLTRHNHAPNTATKMSPAEMVFNFVPTNPTNQMNPHFKHVPKLKKDLQKKGTQTFVLPEQKFKVGDQILYRLNAPDFVKWIPGQIITVLSRLRYIIAIGNNLKQAHKDQLKLNKGKILHRYPVIFQREEENENPESEDEFDTCESGEEVKSPEPSVPRLPRRSKRIRYPPRRFTFD